MTSDMLDTAKTVALALLIALVLRIFLFQPFTIPSGSMEPLLRDGDYIVTSKFDYGLSRWSVPFGWPPFAGRIGGQSPRRGDVIVFKPPHDTHVDWIKRLIGLPGDRIQMIHGVLYVNGQAAARKDLGPGVDPDQPSRAVRRLRETLPGGPSYVILQESPDHDGENTGVYVVPPDSYFLMGDNRDNSLDSRWPSGIGAGFVPGDNLEAKARGILVSWRGASLWRPWTWLTRLDPSRCLRPI